MYITRTCVHTYIHILVVMLRQIPTAHAVCSHSVQDEEEEEDPNIRRLKNMRPEQRKYWRFNYCANEALKS